MDETIISSELESTTSTETSAETNTEKGSVTAPQGQNTEQVDGVEGGTSTDDGGNEPPAPYLMIQYNHEEKGLTRDEAVTLAQKGMAYDSMYATIQRAAALKGMDVKAFIESFEKAQDEAYREELINKYGEDDMETVNALMEVYNSKKDSKIKSAIEAENQRKAEAQKTLEGRLADEFISLQKEFPDIKDFDALPKSVKAEAAKGENLLFAYLKFQHSEIKRAEAANQTADAAKKASGGSMSSPEVTSGTMDALMKGLYG